MHSLAVLAALLGASRVSANVVAATPGGIDKLVVTPETSIIGKTAGSTNKVIDIIADSGIKARQEPAADDVMAPLKANVVFKTNDNIGDKPLYLYIWGRDVQDHIVNVRSESKATRIGANSTEFTLIDDNDITAFVIPAGSKGKCILLPPLSEGRAYYTYQPLKFFAHIDGSGQVRVVYPNPGNFADPNTNCRYSFIEFNESKQNKNDFGAALSTALNATASWFALPLTIRLTSSNGVPMTTAYGPQDTCVEKLCKMASSDNEITCIIRDDKSIARALFANSKREDPAFIDACKSPYAEDAAPIGTGTVVQFSARTCVVDNGDRGSNKLR